MAIGTLSALFPYTMLFRSQAPRVTASEKPFQTDTQTDTLFASGFGNPGNQGKNLSEICAQRDYNLP
jgi:hypothetical protein